MCYPSIGFARLSRGKDAGAYHHDLFLKGKPTVAKGLIRTKVKGNGHKTMRLVDMEPDFYAMPPIVKDVKDSSIFLQIQARNSPSQLEVALTAKTSKEQYGIGPNSPSAVSDTSSCFGNTDTTVQQPPMMPQSFHPRTVSDLSATYSNPASSTEDTSFVNELNQIIFIHELALGCSILCKLRNANL